MSAPEEPSVHPRVALVAQLAVTLAGHDRIVDAIKQEPLPDSTPIAFYLEWAEDFVAGAELAHHKVAMEREVAANAARQT